VAFGFIFGTYIFQSSVVFHWHSLGCFGCVFGLVLFSWYLGFILGLCRFLCKPVGVIRFFWTCNFSRDLVPGICVLFRICMCSTWYLLIFTVFVPTLLYPSIYPLPIDYLPVFSSIIGYCLKYRLNTGPLNPESVTLTTEPWSCG
jgi:hypothetical protein